MLKVDFIKRLQLLLNTVGERLTVDGEFGKKTEAALDRYNVSMALTKKQTTNSLPPNTGRVENPAYLEAKKYEGKKEKDKAFGAWLSGYWKKVGLKNYKTIIGSSFAWCALFIVAVQSDVGQDYIASASAKRQGTTGAAIDWKANGIPRGAIVHINHNYNCTGGSGNHVGFADGDCAASDLVDSNGNVKSGAVVAIFGGNQENEVKRTVYDAKEVCEVRWPKEVPLPGKVTKSLNCSGKKANESTR